MHHLMEEIQAKDHIINECQSIINTHDRSLQKFIKLNGSNVKNPKEEPYGRIILQNYKKAKAVQAEKVSLAEKAAILVYFVFVWSSYASLTSSKVRSPCKAS